MMDFSRLQSCLNDRFVGRIHDLHAVRDDAFQFRFERYDTLQLAAVLLNEFTARLILITAVDRRAASGVFEVHYLFVNDKENWFVDAVLVLPQDDAWIDSLALLDLPAAKMERELADMFGIRLAGHPNPIRLVRHSFWPEDFYPLLKDSLPPADFRGQAVPYPFLPVEGEGIYEIPVGPVHAGIIEPGHFRFSVLGESIVNMQMHLFFTHKGVEKLFENRKPAEGVEIAERISGDSSVAHALAYCQALETLAGVVAPARAAYLRVVLLEMERFYNHVADFGAIANDSGFAVALSHCLRIRERLLRLNKRLTGNRLLRGGIIPGGVTRDLPANLNLSAELGSVLEDFEEVVAISLNNSILLDRLETTGMLTNQTAADHGVLGFVARASGIDADVRRDHPFAAYGRLDFQVPVYQSGDVYARTLVRVEEVRQSVSIIRQALEVMPSSALCVPLPSLPAWQAGWSLVEGWRGAILCWLMADENGTLFRVKVKDPSFNNWPALPFALLKNIVPDFPLCNKSFNQSYSGNDL